MFKADITKKDKPVWFWIVAILWAVPTTIVGGVILGTLFNLVGIGNDVQTYRVALVLAAAISMCWFATRKGLYFPLFY